MNRCTSRPLAALPLVALLLITSGSLVSLPAVAQTDAVTANVRQFPKTAVRGELVVLMAPEISMDGKADRLSPGARIRDSNDQLVLSGTLLNQRLVVNYVRENTGLVQQVWILNRDEARQKMPGQDGGGILTNIRSLFDTQPVTDDGKTPYDKLPGFKQ